MEEAARRSEATVVAQSFHEFKPYGVSGAVIIQESHYTIHTWPEHGYAAVDLFYCGGTIAVHKAVEVLQEQFKPKRIKFLLVRRGLQHEVQHPYSLWSAPTRRRFSLSESASARLPSLTVEESR